MRHIRSHAIASLALAVAAAPVHAIDFTLLTSDTLIGVLSGDGFLGNADDILVPGLNTFGGASQFSAINTTYGFLGGTISTAGVTPFGLVEQQFFGVSTHTGLATFGEWNSNAFGVFNQPFTQSLDAGSPSVITLFPDQSYTTSFVIDDPTYGGRVAFTSEGHYLARFQSPGALYSGDLLTHFDTVLPLLPNDWAGVAQESQTWEVLDGPQAGVTGFTSLTFFSTDQGAVPFQSTPAALPAPWQTTGWASVDPDFPDQVQIGSPFEPVMDGTATLAGGATATARVLTLGAKGNGLVTVTGAGSALTVDSIYNFDAGHGTLEVLDGARIDAEMLGRFSAGRLEVRVDGTGSQLNLNSASFAGIADQGTPVLGAPSRVTVSHGAELNIGASGNANAVLFSFFSPLAVEVDGAGSALRIEGTSEGTQPTVLTGIFLMQESSLGVTNGGLVEVVASNVGFSGIGLGGLLPNDPNLGPARLLVDGAGSRVNAGPFVAVGELFIPNPVTGVFETTGQAGGASVLTVRNGGVLETDRVLIGTAGTLNGSGGTLIGNVENHGVVAVGESPGVMVIDGDYTQGADGRLVIEIGGNTPGVDFDLLTVNGTMTLGGTLEIVLLNGFVPDADDSFGFLSAANIVGAFANIVLPTLGNGQPLALHFGPSGITAGAAPVPVPGALWLFGGAVAMLAGRRRGHGVAMATCLAG